MKKTDKEYVYTEWDYQGVRSIYLAILDSGVVDSKDLQHGIEERLAAGQRIWDLLEDQVNEACWKLAKKIWESSW